jgi:hypothetical protein
MLAAPSSLRVAQAQPDRAPDIGLRAQVLIHTEEQLDLVRKEIQLHASLEHRCILKLLAHDIISTSRKPATGTGPAPGQSVQMGNLEHIALNVRGGNLGMSDDHDSTPTEATAYMLFPAYPNGEASCSSWQVGA